MYIELEKINNFMEQLENFDTIIIHRHVRPDPDAFGSQLGLQAILRATYPNKTILAAGTMTKGLSWMGEMNKVSKEVYEEALVIVVDTANQPRIDGEYYAHGKMIVKIDHHPEVDAYGELQMVYTQASSCSEIIANIALFSDKLTLTAEAARLLYAGIVGDTGRFMFDSTTALTFETTAKLLDYGVQPFEINDRFNTKTLNQARFQAFITEKLAVEESGVAHVLIKREDLDHFGITEEESNVAVGIPGGIEGITSWVVFIEQKGDKPFWRARIRSKGPAINDIAAHYEGGGHPKASGANIYSLDQMGSLILELIEETKAFYN